MKRYAMILADERRVIEIVESEEVPYFPPTPDGEEIEAILCDNEDVERGYWYYIDGEFKLIMPEAEPEVRPEPTQLDNIEAQVSYIAMMME